MPSRCTRSDSPTGRVATALSWSGDPVYATLLSRPSTVQIDTVRASYCQDSIRASYGCAASHRNDDRVGLGVAAAFRAGLAEVPGPDVRLQGLVRVADLLDDVLGGLRAEPVIGP